MKSGTGDDLLNHITDASVHIGKDKPLVSYLLLYFHEGHNVNRLSGEVISKN
jgi:hypothetical protein